MLSMVRLNARDITNTPYNFREGDVDGIEVVLSSRLGSVSGVVHEGGKPAAGAAVVLLGVDELALDRAGLRFRMVSTDERGEFLAPSMLAGQYVALAMATRITDLSQLTVLRSRMTEFSVTAAGQARLSLGVVR
jgi:hypothetical protein